MNKKILWAVSLIAGMATQAGATTINLAPFESDFQTLMNSVARDVAPSLRLGALSADLQGDATIDHFNFSLLGVGLTASDGLGKVLRSDSNTHWGFVLPLADLVNKNMGSNNFFEQLMIYPALKMGVGAALPGLWDVSVTGIWWPQALVSSAKGMAPANIRTKMDQLDPQFSFANLGIQVRKTLIEDSGYVGIVPAVSLGAGYHFTSFDLGIKLQSLSSLGLSPPSLGTNETFDMTGSFAVRSTAHIVTLDLQTSKHLLIFTPYGKLTAAYQNSSFAGSSSLDASVIDSTNSANNITTHIAANPVVTLSNFSFLTTTGLEINLFVVTVNVNVAADLGQALLNVKDLSLTGINANAFSLNAGLRSSF